MLHSHHLKGAFYSIKHRRKLFAKLQNTDMNNENHNEHSSHPTDNTYIKIAVILGVITALEVAIFYVGWIPDLVFLKMLFGYRSLEDLEYAFPDCIVSSQEARVLLDILFPRQISQVWAIE